MNMVFEKWEVLSDYRKILTEPLYEETNKSECGNYRGIRLGSVGNKLLCNMILFRLICAVGKVIREEQ